ncbi:uncharacterized protein C8Q71DRAFT_79644 [Rhodofomes roseus]|uniref:Uncharacterized protein n=1 Tax=Rhodofomes roseus TaxID=34475 RepID=A0ABQ8KFE1_9APHY|nr:uncharacterized protein C8Q71DRAFT_79644 [Rhodofomes roseus]KAH9836358.1 hypothetical protein C8Q71DRAFT_79644 [Rhodofomes roseus]
MYTEAWIYDPLILKEIEDFAHRLCEEIQKNGFALPSDAELVLDLEVIPDHAPVRTDLVTGEQCIHYWTYYFINPAERILFWLHPIDILEEKDVDRVRYIQSDSHIKHLIESYYWKHIESFPAGHTISEDLRKEALSTLVHANVDQVTSASSTVSMKPDDMLNLTEMVKTLQGRLMYLFVHNRYHFSFGQNVAKLDRFKSIFDDNANGGPSKLFSFLSLVLFNAPNVHLETLEHAWTDESINELFWTKCIARLQKDWEEAVLTATVLLNANISFLTINDVDTGPGPRSSAQLASYVSTIASIAAIVIGMLVIRQHRVKPKETATDVVTYLTSRKHPQLGLEVLALVHSLPYALLIVVSFMLAFAFENFRVLDIPTIAVATTSWALAAILLVLCLHTIWEGGGFSLRKEIGALYQRANNNVQLWRRRFAQKLKQLANSDSHSVPSVSSNIAVPGGIEMQGV